MSVSLREIHALWTEIFGEPPSVNADARLLNEILIRCLPLAPPYGDVERARGPTDLGAEPEDGGDGTKLDNGGGSASPETKSEAGPEA